LSQLLGGVVGSNQSTQLAALGRDQRCGQATRSAARRGLSISAKITTTSPSGVLDECDLGLFSVAKIKKILFKNNRLVIRFRLAKVAKHLATPTVPFADSGRDRSAINIA
jgi:hypothetical protein